MSLGAVLKRVYLVVWVSWALAGGCMLLADTGSSTQDAITLRAYLAGHAVTLDSLRRVDFTRAPRPVRLPYEYMHARHQPLSPAEREYWDAARIAQAPSGRMTGGSLASEWGWVLLLAGVLPALAWWFLGRAVARFDRRGRV
jgi:hypothetical protein